MSADRQKRYRDRKKREEFFRNEYIVTEFLKQCDHLEIGQEIREILEEVYEKMNENMVRKLSFTLSQHTSLVLAVRQFWPGRISAQTGPVQGGDNAKEA